jgi:tRNA pseudouridine55 synthase
VCSTGTYIRTLADDIARALGGRAHLTALRRVRNGSLHVNDASTVPEIVAATNRGTFEDMVLRPSEALSSMPEVRVDEAGEFRVRNGSRLVGQSLEADGDVVRIANRRGELLAVYRSDGMELVPEVVLP